MCSNCRLINVCQFASDMTIETETKNSISRANRNTIHPELAPWRSKEEITQDSLSEQ